MRSLISTTTSALSRGSLTRSISRPTSRALSAVGDETAIRMASVQGESLVQTEKLHEIDRVAREAITGQAMLNAWADTLTNGDARLFSELNFFTGIARMGKGEVIADMVSKFCQEGRR